MTVDRWTLFHRARPVSMNQYVRMNYHAISKIRLEWRQAFAWLAKEARVPHYQRIEVEVWCILPNRAGWQDIGNCYPSAKWAIDGLVDAGVIPDDKEPFLGGLTFGPPS